MNAYPNFLFMVSFCYASQHWCCWYAIEKQITGMNKPLATTAVIKLNIFFKNKQPLLQSYYQILVCRDCFLFQWNRIYTRHKDF